MASAKERPIILEGYTMKIPTGLGSLFLTVNELDGKPFEIFATIGKSGRSTTAKTEAIGRLVSLALRSGIPVDEVAKQLKGIGGEFPVANRKELILSVPDAIRRALEERYMKKAREIPQSDNPNIEKIMNENRSMLGSLTLSN